MLLLLLILVVYEGLYKKNDHSLAAMQSESTSSANSLDVKKNQTLFCKRHFSGFQVDFESSKFAH